MAKKSNAVRDKKGQPSAPPAKSTPAGQDSQSSINPIYPFSPYLSFSTIFLCHYAAAMLHPIQDCDEVFNYWEPTHYLTHAHGFQTWEYAPIYAIRSWAYAGLHAVFTLAGKAVILGLDTLPSAYKAVLFKAALLTNANKSFEFYFLRIALAFVCALCELRLFSKISATVDRKVAATFLLVSSFSPGMWHASAAYLPSSFTMYTTMLGMAAFMGSAGGRKRTAEGIFAIGVGAVLGWPFAAAMAIPFLLEELVLAVNGDKQRQVDLFWAVFYGTGGTLLVLAAQGLMDYFFYKKIVVVPFNIVWYNIFSKSGGPDLYGTEPWHFYLRNLFLNFHVWLILALLSMPLLLAERLFSGPSRKKPLLREYVLLTPFYLWLAIFTLQPHKEERFIYPAYPALAFNAAYAFYFIYAKICSTDAGHRLSQIPINLRFSVFVTFVFGACVLSAFRVYGTIDAYSAPLSIYKPLHDPGLAQPGDTVCLGKEWYRFPSHFFLPPDVHAKFVKSEFSGLLPGDFLEHPWLEPSGMNDENREDIGKYTKLRQCTFLVDLQLPSTAATDLEPIYIADTERWERVKCLPFMDSASTGILGRLVYIPNWSFIPQKYRRVYGDYCLLRRRKLLGALNRDPVPHIETLG